MGDGGRVSTECHSARVPDDKTHVTAALQEHARDLALLHLRETELEQTITGVDVVLSEGQSRASQRLPPRPRRSRMVVSHLACHDDAKDPLPDIRVHTLRPRQLRKLLITLSLLRLELQRRPARGRLLCERVPGPGRTDEPPLAAGRRRADFGEGHTQGVRCCACQDPRASQRQTAEKSASGSMRTCRSLLVESRQVLARSRVQIERAVRSR